MTRWLFVLGYLASTGACSFALSGPDSNAPRSKAPTCDTSKTLVVLDMVAATIAGVATLAAGGNNTSDAIAPALITALFVGSAIRGNSVVGSCRTANDDYVARAERANPSAPSQPPAIAEETTDEQRPPPRIPAAKPEPVAAATESPEPQETPQAPPPHDKQPPVAPPAPPPIQLWVDFWKEIR